MPFASYRVLYSAHMFGVADAGLDIQLDVLPTLGSFVTLCRGSGFETLNM